MNLDIPKIAGNLHGIGKGELFYSKFNACGPRAVIKTTGSILIIFLVSDIGYIFYTPARQERAAMFLYTTFPFFP